MAYLGLALMIVHRCWLSTACLLAHTIAIAWDVILLPGVYLQLLILNLIAYIRHQHSLGT
jgi:hypothetical protein